MREINEHKINSANDRIDIRVLDEPGPGGAHHEYDLVIDDPCSTPPRITRISFQNGPISESGVNGLTHEALLSVILDRLRSFQSGPYACRENALALTKIEEAQHWLLSRTRSRMARGVEGAHKA